MDKGTLILLGVVCVIGAIIGGGVKVIQVELRTFNSLWRQTLLGIFGIVLILFGVAQPDSGPVVNEDKASAETSNPAALGTPSESSSPAAVAAASAPAASPKSDTTSQASPVTLTSRVDVFWCGGEGGGFNRNLANMVAQAVGRDAPETALRVRPIAPETNAGSSYQIHHAIVRFDPGEQDQARYLAQIASEASGIEFRATPALPGSPSVDYLSIFVCD